MITTYVTINSRPEFSRNKTGFGYMVYDIARSVGKLEQVDVLCTDSRGDAFEENSVQYLGRSFGIIVKYLLFCLSPLSLLELLGMYKMTKNSAVRLVYYWLMSGYLSHLLKKGHYDMVHIHGCGFSTDLWIRVCKKYNQKYIVTLHGLNSFSDTVRLEPAGKQYERDFLQRVVTGGIPITVISTGMKRLIEKIYGKRCSNINVVCNSFSFTKSKESDSNYLRKKYNIPEKAKMLLYVGNISRNKNQAQMVRAFELLPDNIKKDTYVLFCGEGNDSSVNLKEMINATGNTGHLIMCGGIDKDLMPSYYQSADGVVLLSYAEGFGLSLIEGMHFGVPCAMPTDLDAFEDIYNPIAVIPIEGREDEIVAISINKLLINYWNKDAIIRYSAKFENSAMAKAYINVYRQLLYE